MNVRGFLADLQQQPTYRDQIAAHHVLPAAAATTAPLDPPLPEPLAAALARQGITSYYTHQVAAVEAARAGRDVVVVTGTASGKTLCYNLPVLEAVLTDRRARALYLFPLKALAQDQLRKLGDLDLWRAVRCATYDGDTPEPERRTVRQVAHLVLSNPDMLHLGILPRHDLWADFLSHLRYLVIDEIHMYRGVFGSHAAHVFRRLLRLCERYGSHPTIIGCSATIANPADLVEQLTGRRPEVIDQDGAPRGAKHLVVWNPPVQDEAAGLRRSGNIEATWLLAELVRRGVRSLGFAVARQEAELVLRYLRAALGDDGGLAQRVAAYRAGYLATERRQLERRLAAGDLLAAVSTVALEAGIDIGGLDAVVLVGYPGTIAGFWQQSGRAGRGQDDSLAVLVCRGSLIDQYFVCHPEALWSAPTETARIDPGNVYILGSHLLCAAYEHPLDLADLDRFGGDSLALLEIFVDEGLLRRQADRWLFTGDAYPAGEVSLRTADNRSYDLVHATTHEVFATADPSRLWEECFPGAIHLHDGEQYLIRSVEEEPRRVIAEPTEVNYYTTPLVAIDVAIDREADHIDLGAVAVSFGELTVTKTTLGFRRVKTGGSETLGVEDVVCPPQRIETTGLWLTLGQPLRELLARHECDPHAALHAVEHALCGALPLVAMCDPRDVRGASTPLHDDLAEPALFIFDQYPGGIGLAERGYEAIEAILHHARDVVCACGCAAGCPACIQSPFCGSGNQPLDKLAAQLILRAAAGEDVAALEVR